MDNAIQQLSEETAAATHIRVRGARVHNLQEVDVDLPLDSLVVITGVSGSGKSSLAFDTIFVEGQRRYLESLSTYTRQFLHQWERPEVDLIDGLPPTISVGQRVATARMRSTLGTTTEIWDFLRLLYARAGQAHCTQCGRPVAQQTTQQIVQRVMRLPERSKVLVMAPVVQARRGGHQRTLEKIEQEGYVRARVDGTVVDLAELGPLTANQTHDIDAIVDRLIIKPEIVQRLTESVDSAIRLSGGTCIVSCQQADDSWEDQFFSTTMSCPVCEIDFPDLETRLFSFNSPYGACITCDGLGRVIDSNEDDSKLSRFEMLDWPICDGCNGTRLNPFARGVTFYDRTLPELAALSIQQAHEIIATACQDIDGDQNQFNGQVEQRAAAQKLLPDIRSRLKFLLEVGLDYLTLDRPTGTLSGGEYQRTRLAGCLGSGLVGVCYILDEPTTGLHPRDTKRLIASLQALRDAGNTVLLVEHDLDVIQRADYVVDLGPGAGRHGGRIIAAGSIDEIKAVPDSKTGQLLERKASDFAKANRKRRFDAERCVTLSDVKFHNLQQLTAKFPFGLLTCVTGVSGSGKSSLVMRSLVPLLKAALAGDSQPHQFLEKLDGHEQIDQVIVIDQSSIGRTGRSNPATYSKAWDEIRRLFAKTRDARIRGFKARRFSFNVAEGRCAQCKGEGSERIEMKYMPDIEIVCSVCQGRRFNPQTLSIRYRDKTVADVLEMTISEGAEFFVDVPKLARLLKTFDRVGLGYLQLGQSARTLSGGEAQRVKLATELSRPATGRSLFVLDEPTTGLHAADVKLLINLLQEIVDAGNTVIVIEHHLDLVAAADWVIDLGPGGGEQGGQIVATGPPQEIAKVKHSATGNALADVK